MKYLVSCIFRDGMSFTCICDDYKDLKECMNETMMCYKDDEFTLKVVSVNKS